MKTLENYLNEAKKVTGSDYQTAIQLNVSRQYISKARKGDGFSDKCSFKLGEILNIDERLIIASAQYSSKEKERDYWEKAWDRIHGMVASFLVTLSASPVLLDVQQCLLCKVRQKRVFVTNPASWGQQSVISIS